MRLVDDKGYTLSPTVQLQASFGTRLPAAQFADYMVRNMGWAAVLETRSSIEVRARPSKINDATLVATLEHVRDARRRKFQLTLFQSGWISSELPSASQAATHLTKLVEQSRTELRKYDFLRRSRQHDGPGRSTSEDALLDAWRTGERRVDQLALMADEHFGGRFVVAGRDETGGTCILAGGGDFNLIGESWMSRLPRLRLADWPDVVYGRWVEESYNEVWRSGEPLLDDVDCFINWPKLGRRRHRYGRIILPCRSALGTELLIGAMRIDDQIDLRAQLH